MKTKYKYHKVSFLLILISILNFSVPAFAQTTIIDSFLHEGIYRTYRLYIPASYTGARPVPVVFNLHGLGSDALEQENYGDFRKIADTANFIIIHPQGANVIFTVKGWNTFGAIGTGADDLGFMSRLLDTVIAKYTINKNKVYATGMSNGGFMSYELACFMSKRITAIASVTGSMTAERKTGCKAAHAIPVMEIHGTADKTVGYDGTNYLSGSPGFTDINVLMNYWVSFNGCGSTAIKTTLPDIEPRDGCTAEHYIWAGGKDGSTVEHYKIIGGKHTWPGSAYITDVTNQDFNASKEIWRFFSQYSLDQFSLGIKEAITTELTVNIYPVPSKGPIQVQLENAYHKVSKIQLTDALGRTNFTIETTDQLISVPRNNLPSGIYYLRISNGEYSAVRKVVFN